MREYPAPHALPTQGLSVAQIVAGYERRKLSGGDINLRGLKKRVAHLVTPAHRDEGMCGQWVDENVPEDEQQAYKLCAECLRAVTGQHIPVVDEFLCSCGWAGKSRRAVVIHGNAKLRDEAQLPL